MCLRKNTSKVSQWTRIFIVLMLTFGNRQFALCSDKNSNSDNYASTQRKIPSSGSGGGGTLEKRSSYAVISDAFSQTVNNEFGSE